MGAEDQEQERTYLDRVCPGPGTLALPPRAPLLLAPLVQTVLFASWEYYGHTVMGRAGEESKSKARECLKVLTVKGSSSAYTITFKGD